ncbi:nuclease-related domain-containing protein [Ornithinibacillus halotolerans]|uniref:NERD domain-containing protein n=1 Tax=Ornithinibacillus halotolerans TaxID=1274357 RepID=A0A916W7I1_9BACI|nr:nuclease-related domain-containing protein [Ornithinibacillus halotolerans]GGA73979.1 hypothetical protein GCM10008025_17140 [Ornithinibacillus halotolerans]
MIYKKRTKSKELRILEILNQRMDLDTNAKKHYLNLKKGYEGELIFDGLTEKLQCECLILNDLLFEMNNTLFQIDSLIILQKKIYFFEVKHNEGDHKYESGNFYKLPNYLISNPLDQLSRSDTLLRQLLSKLKYNLPIEPNVVFINQKFTLYQAPLDQPIIYPTQVRNYLSNLNATPSRLTNRHRELAEKLVSLHIVESPYDKLPEYEYGDLRKGIVCLKCESFLEDIEGKIKYTTCKNCGSIELTDNAILRTINDFKLLFPNEKLTTKTIFEWCKVVKSERKIRNILLKYYKKSGEHRWSYYE